MENERSRKLMNEEEKTAEVWEDEEKERHERASADLLKEDEKGATIVNPPTAGGKILTGSKGNGMGARSGYIHKKSD